MGVTLMVALVFWLASSLIEYKIIKTIPAVKPFFDNPVGGIIISILIGTLVGMAIGTQSGLGVFIGQILGLATNQFTYKLFCAIAQINASVKEAMTQFKASWQKNKDAIIAAAQAFRAMCRGIAKFFMFIIKILALPGRIANYFSRGDYAKTLQ